MNKILVFDISFLTGNNRTPIIEKIRYWQSKKTQVTIFCTSEAKKNYKKLIKGTKFITIHQDKSPNNRFLLIFEDLKRNFLSLRHLGKIARVRYGCIYSISSVLDLVLIPWICKTIYNIKWTTVFDNTVEKDAPGNRPIKLLAYFFYRLSLFFLKKADYLFVVTKLIKLNLIQEGFSKSRLIVTGNGVENRYIENGKQAKKYIYDSIFIGRINETKGLYYMARVVKKIVSKMPNYKIAVMGRGDDESEKKYLKYLKEVGVYNNFVFLGFLTGKSKFDAIKQSKSFLFLSPSESFGVALLEAYCCGLPCFVYDLDAYHYIYKKNDIHTFPVGEVVEVAAKMIKVIKQISKPHLPRKNMVRRFNWKRIADIEYEKITSG